MTGQKLFIAGGTGFVGTALLERLLVRENTELTLMVRQTSLNLPDQVTLFRAQAGLRNEFIPLNNVQTVIHAAARVHMMSDKATNALAEYRNTNVEGTLNLARQSAEAGVKRFIFLSSIKVNGEATAIDQAFRADDAPAPSDPYGVSKMEAEIGLRSLAAETGMEVVIIRPVLVYGPGVRANFLNMMSWLNRGFPLPLGATNNKRSLVALDNLVDLIITCIDHPAAANQTFLVSDGEDLSTTELLRRMSKALGKPARLLPAPPSMLSLSAKLLGKGDMAQRLCGSLQVDISKTKQLLAWRPPVTVDQALQETADEFLANLSAKRK